jgi:hypothetical protein
MRRLLLSGLTVALALSAGAEKYEGEFMALGVGARSLGMGGAAAAFVSDVTAGYWNPAGLARLDSRQAAAMHAETFGSLLNHDYVAYAMPWGSGDRGEAVAVSLTRLGGGGVYVTTLPNPDEPVGSDNRPYVVSEESHGDYVLTISYARAMSGKLSAGVSVKAIYRDLVTNSGYGAGLDVGARWTPTDVWSFGATLMDATSTVLSYDTGTTTSILPTLKTGVAYSRHSGFLNGDVTLAGDADVRFEGRDESAQLSGGPLSADFRAGVEYAYRGVVAGRMGTDAGNLTAGVGLVIGSASVDFAYLSHSELDATYRISAVVGF